MIKLTRVCALVIAALVVAMPVIAQELPPSATASEANPGMEGAAEVFEQTGPPKIAPAPVPGNTTQGPICPPMDLSVSDSPDDEGGSILVSWRPCDPKYTPSAKNFVIYRSAKTDKGYSPFLFVDEISAGDAKYLQKTKDGEKYQYADEGMDNGTLYLYRVAALDSADGGGFSYAFSIVSDLVTVDFGPVASDRQIIPYKKRNTISDGSVIAAPINIRAEDKPNDAGGSIIVSWTPPAAAETVAGLVYRIYRATDREGDYKFIGSTGKNRTQYEDATHKDAPKDAIYSYLVVASDAGGAWLSVSERSNATQAKMQIINWSTWNFFFFAVALSIFITYFIRSIKGGKKLFIRKIAGLEAIEESIGRATEMGKPVMYIPGLMDMNDVQTVASVVILGRIARQVAEYDTRLMVPTSKSLVMTTGRETVREAFISVGRPDAYNDDIVTYLTDEQFGYVAGVNGLMVRNKPATCLYFGAFFAESLILAETGNSIGAIQIAGTAMPAQLPFFIAACDYTLIGEELFAASAYLSGEPKLLGSLKGQDIGKLLGMFGMIVGGIFATIAELSGAGWAIGITDFFQRLFTAASN